jgi:RNase P subunit RPR2
MRCKACDKMLSDYESTRRSIDSDEFIDLCNTCYSSIRNDIQVSERFDLLDVQSEIDNSEE